METIRIEAQISQSDFVKLNFFMLYRKPLVLIMTAVGVWLLLVSIAAFLGVEGYTNPEANLITPFLIGFCFSVALPLTVLFSARKNYRNHARVRETMVYAFDAEKYTVKGDSFSSEMQWPQTHKVVEHKNHVLIYQAKNQVNFIPKRSFDSEQWESFKSLLQGLSSVKVKLRG